MMLLQNLLVSKNQNKAELNNLDDSEILSGTFLGLRTSLQPHWPHRLWQPHGPKQPLQLYIIKELPDPNPWIILGTKMTNTGLFCGLNHQKFNFSLISDRFSVGGS